ncbi:MAG: sigma-70 family RNA polymerase sigma factor [Planctomycetes bacterium]|nr:sigma-70 family RNA polymerase sigma factor [Planctomycetota bacterium]
MDNSALRILTDNSENSSLESEGLSQWQNLTDEDLFVLTRDGERDAFRLLVERLEGKALHIARGYVRSIEIAREIVQDAFLKVYNSREKFDPKQSFQAWYFRILRNHAIDNVRRMAPGGPGNTNELVGDFETASQGPLQQASRNERLEMVRVILESLPLQSRQVLTLREFQSMSCSEIGEEIGATAGTVRWRLHNARKLFREQWERSFGPETSSDVL